MPKHKNGGCFSLVHCKLVTVRSCVNWCSDLSMRVMYDKCTASENKTGTSKVGAIPEAQKAQNIFFRKKLEIFEKFCSFGKFRIVPKKVKGGSYGLY